MHKIFELKEMDQEKLVELASELKIKNVKKMSKDDLVYAILDTEAAAKAASRRGRPRRKSGTRGGEGGGERGCENSRRASGEDKGTQRTTSQEY